MNTFCSVLILINLLVLLVAHYHFNRSMKKLKKVVSDIHLNLLITSHNQYQEFLQLLIREERFEEAEQLKMAIRNIAAEIRKLSEK